GILGICGHVIGRYRDEADSLRLQDPDVRDHARQDRLNIRAVIADEDDDRALLSGNVSERVTLAVGPGQVEIGRLPAEPGGRYQSAMLSPPPRFPRPRGSSRRGRAASAECHLCPNSTLRASLSLAMSTSTGALGPRPRITAGLAAIASCQRLTSGNSAMSIPRRSQFRIQQKSAMSAME